MRAIVGIVLSVLLVLGQSISVASVMPTKAPKPMCKRCACDSPCCIQAPTPAQDSVPAAPAPSAPEVSQFILWVAASSFLLPDAQVSSSRVSPASHPPPDTAVPIYERHCTYLI